MTIHKAAALTCAVLMATTALVTSRSEAQAAGAPLVANDMFEDAAEINGESGIVRNWTYGATLEAGESPCLAASTSTVWYRWTAPHRGFAHFSAEGSDFDSIVAAYSGDSLDDLTQLSCNDYAHPYDYGWAHWKVVPGETYYIAVSAEHCDAGNLKLTWSLPDPTPPNDDFANAREITDLHSNYFGDTTWASKEAGEPDHAGYSGGSSVWYDWVAPHDGTATVKAVGPAGFVLEAYTGSSFDSLQSLDSDSDEDDDGTTIVEFPVEMGETYSAAIDRKGEEVGDFQLFWNLPPVNDDLADARVLTGTSLAEIGTNVDATAEPGEPAHGFLNAEKSVWYEWEAPTTGPVSIDVRAKEWPLWRLGLAVYTGDAMGSLGLIEKDYDFWHYLQDHPLTRVTFDATAGEVYKIAIDGEGSSGPFRLRINPPPLPGDNYDDDVFQETWWSGTRIWDNVHATKEPGEPNHAGNAGGASMWFNWRPDEDGMLLVSTEGSEFDTLLGVYSGESPDSMTELASSDDYNGNAWSRVVIPVTAWQWYRIAVDGKNGAQGTFKLRWQDDSSAPISDARAMQSSSIAFVPDGTPGEVPTVTAPTTGFAVGTQLTTSLAHTVTRWSAVDDFDTVVSELEYRSGDGAFAPVDLCGVRDVYIGSSEVGTSEQYRVRGRDSAMQYSEWMTGKSQEVGFKQETSMMKQGTWTTSASGLGGSTMSSVTKGSALIREVKGRRVALVSTTGPNRGKVRILINGNSVGLIDLYSPTVIRRRIVSNTVLGPGRHTFRAEVTGWKNPLSSGKRVEVDAVALIRGPRS